MGNGVLTRSDLWQWRRVHAWRLSRRGWRQRDIADAFDISEGAVSHWLAAARLRGEAALMARPRPGRPGKLTPDQLRMIPDFLGHGAEAYGFRGQVWTTTRIAKVIEEEFDVSFHKAHVSRLLHCLHWTPQSPVLRALQRDEHEIERWQKVVWPQLKTKAQRERRTLVFVDESGFYLLPGVVRTYARKANLRSSKSGKHATICRSWAASLAKPGSTVSCGKSRSTVCMSSNFSSTLCALTLAAACW